MTAGSRRNTLLSILRHRFLINLSNASHAAASVQLSQVLRIASTIISIGFYDHAQVKTL